MGTVHLFTENIDFIPPHPKRTLQWIRQAIREEKFKLSFLNFIFCNDSYLLSINQEYLQHNELTDIITFSYAENTGIIEGDIFISIERVEENANKFQTKFDEELRRVMIHGVLHLMGYNDKSKSELQTMREKENSYLSLYSQ